MPELTHPDQGARILVLDVENAPNLAWVWGKYEQTALAYEREHTLMSFAAKWTDAKKIDCFALPDFSLFKKKPYSDEALVDKLYEYLNEADIVVTHNGDRFDLKKANTQALLNGETPYRPVKSVDTLKVCHEKFMFNSNKLGDVCERLGIGTKLEHGHDVDLWVACIKGDPKAWALMKRYNIHDVRLTEQLYYRFLPWISGHPNISLGTGKTLACPWCGKTGTIGPRGWRMLKSYEARLYHCYKSKGGCGAWPTGERRKLPGIILTS